MSDKQRPPGDVPPRLEAYIREAVARALLLCASKPLSNTTATNPERQTMTGIDEVIVRLEKELTDAAHETGLIDETGVIVDVTDLRALLDAYGETRARELGFVSMASRIHNRLSRWKALARARREQVRKLEGRWAAEYIAKHELSHERDALKDEVSEWKQNSEACGESLTRVLHERDRARELLASTEAQVNSLLTRIYELEANGGK